MAPYERGSTHSIELFNCRSAKRKGSKYPKGKFPRKVMFQKKLIVICYVGEKAPKQFTLKDSVIALRGVLPEIDVEAGELDVRRVIADVIISAGEEFLSCSRYSFEFIEANGKSLYVPAKPTGFEWFSWQWAGVRASVVRSIFKFRQQGLPSRELSADR